MTSVRSDDGTLSTVVAKTRRRAVVGRRDRLRQTSSSLSGASDSIRAVTFVLAEALYWIDSGVTASWPRGAAEDVVAVARRQQRVGRQAGGDGRGRLVVVLAHAGRERLRERVDADAHLRRALAEHGERLGRVVGIQDVGDVVDDRVERVARARVDERAERPVGLAVVVVVALVEGDVADLVDAPRRLEALVARDERDELLGGVLARRERPALGAVADREAHAAERLGRGGGDARVDRGREVEVAAVELRGAQNRAARVQAPVDLRRDAVDAHLGIRALGRLVRHVDRRAARRGAAPRRPRRGAGRSPSRPRRAGAPRAASGRRRCAPSRR